MTTPNQILVDLLAGQSTADSIAGRLRVPALAIEAMLHRLAKEGSVRSGTIAESIPVWLLTTEGTTLAISLRPSRERRGKSAQPATPV